MKKYTFISAIIIIMIATSTIYFDSNKKVVGESGDIPNKYVAYDGEVKHFFTHELIYSTKKAFSKKNNLRYCFDRDHLTTNEFIKFLDTMRENNYVLVDFDMLYEVKNGKITKKSLLLPLNKKPFTLSVDDMSYDTSGKGIINKIIIDENGEIKDYTEGEEISITDNRESITILENYLKKYPDFSINNSKICICVNGYDGILGYRTQKNDNVKNREEEIEELKNVVKVLKEKGYTFGCHTYSHSFINNSMGPNFLVKDLLRWDDEVKTIVGDTDIFCFPGGIHNAKSYNDRIVRDKFKILLCVGIDLNKENEHTEDYIYIYRITLDGNSLRTYPNMYRDIFEPSEIYDNKERFIKYLGI